MPFAVPPSTGFYVGKRIELLHSTIITVGNPGTTAILFVCGMPQAGQKVWLTSEHMTYIHSVGIVSPVNDNAMAVTCGSSPTFSDFGQALGAVDVGITANVEFLILPGATGGGSGLLGPSKYNDGALFGTNATFTQTKPYVFNIYGCVF